MSKIEFFIKEKQMSANEMDKWVAAFWGVTEHIDSKWYCSPLPYYGGKGAGFGAELQVMMEYPDWYNRLAEPLYYSDVKKEYWTAQEAKDHYMAPFLKYPIEEVMKVDSLAQYIRLMDEWIKFEVSFRIPSNALAETEVKRVPKHIAMEIDYGNDID